MDWHQPDCLAIAPLQQAYHHLHESVRSRAPFILDVGNPSLHCHTSVEQLWTSDEAGISLTALMTACISRMFMWGDLRNADPESSVSLVRLPSPSWTHLWTAWLPFPVWRGEDLAGLPEMPNRPPLEEPIEELWSCLSNSWSSGTMLWQPTTGLVGVLTCHDAPALPWTPSHPATCGDCVLRWWDCSSSADELTGPWDAFSAGALL